MTGTDGEPQLPQHGRRPDHRRQGRRQRDLHSAHASRDDRGAVPDGQRRRRDQARPDSRHRRQAGRADETQLQGDRHQQRRRYTKVTNAEKSPRRSTTPCSSGFARSADFDPARRASSSPVSPIVGTVNLKNAKDSTGNSAAEHRHRRHPRRPAAAAAQQHADHAGFAMPGFDGRAARFPRISRSPTRPSRPAGSSSTTARALWPDLDGRAWLKGTARTPADPTSAEHLHLHPERLRRRLGGGLHDRQRRDPDAAHGRRRNTSTLISTGPVASRSARSSARRRRSWMRRRSIRRPTTTTGARCHRHLRRHDYKNRRALIFVGANDGMIHAIDARTGYEVWAFIPYNLLPKLRDAQRRPAGRAVRLLRRQLAEDRRGQDQRRRGAAC